MLKDESVWLSLWAKSEPYHLLWRHLLDVGALVKTLAPRFWPHSPIPHNWLCYLVALHDIGKADALFQKKAPERCTEYTDLLNLVYPDFVRGFRHEARSAEWLEEWLQGLGWGEEALCPIVMAVKGHHGNFDPELLEDEDIARWEPIRNELATLIERVVGPLEPFSPRNFTAENASVVGLMLSGLIVLCDWIASNDKQFYGVLAEADEKDPERYFAMACERAREVVAQLELDVERVPEGKVSPLVFADVWPGMSALRPSQKALENAAHEGVTPGLAILEAPMGEGKTEGAIFLAEEWNRQRQTTGTYIALPTQATSNQMHSRYQKYLGQRSPSQGAPRLVHGMAWLRDDKTPEHAPETDSEDAKESSRALEWFASAKRALLAPEGVGTVDQVLMAALNVKHGFLRLFGLGQKVLIVDEVHAYDAFMTTILCRLLAWCKALGIPVILLSATLSQSQKAQLVGAWTTEPLPESDNYPLLTFVGSDGKVSLQPVDRDDAQRKTISIECHAGLLGEPAKIAALAAALVKDGGCLCVLVNTVRVAQDTFQALEALGIPEKERFLFHARFPADRRDAIEKEMIRLFGPHPEDKSLPNPERPKRAILIATQVVEQSLDVCFDSFVSELAPVDLLLQRSGRLHRHLVNSRPNSVHHSPTLHVLLPETATFSFGVTGKIYDEELLLRTLALLYREGENAFSLPEDFRPLVEGCYGNLPIPAGCVPESQLEAARTKREEKMALFQQKAKTHLIPTPDPEVFQFGQSTQAVDESEDGEKASYLRAQTRLGDDTQAVLVLSDKRLILAYKKALEKGETLKSTNARWSPHRKLLRRFFLRKVNLACWWLYAQPAEGYEPLIQKDAPRWLRNHAVLVAPGGVWKGVRAATKSKPEQLIEICDDPVLGMRLVVTGERDESEQEADSDV